jgi:hypothetical protein
MAATIKDRFGHEENFSRYLLESGHFAQLLERAGFTVAGEGVLELPVAKGHEGREGRLDIYQPTTAGVVIGEMQYGTSDSNHRNRFEGYAKSVANPAAIVWVAEQFRDKDLQAVAMSKVPVICVQVKQTACNNIVLTAIGGARLSAQSLDKRVARANLKAKQLLQDAQVEQELERWTSEMGSVYWRYPDSWQWEMSVEEVVEHVVERSFLDKGAYGRRRLERVIGSEYYSSWKTAFTPHAQAAWAKAKEQADANKLKNEAEEAKQRLVEQKIQAEYNRHQEWRQSLPSMLCRERDEQNAIPAIKAAKLKAQEACRLWGEEVMDADSVEQLYRNAEALCLEHGFRWLIGIPYVGNFIPERYRLQGTPREIADDMPGLFDMGSLVTWA